MYRLTHTCSAEPGPASLSRRAVQRALGELPQALDSALLGCELILGSPVLSCDSLAVCLLCLRYRDVE